jgi:cell division protease FtsH
MGGRAAELLAFGDLSTGAADDLVKATAIARTMVVSYGMSERVGSVSLQPLQGQTAEALWPPARPGHGPDVERAVDAEVRRLMDEALARARAILEARRGALLAGARRLLEAEVLEGDELERLVGPLAA